VLQVKALTKTGKTRRIPLDRGTVELLREHQDRQEERAGLAGAVLARSAYIFSDAIDGSTFWRPDSTSRRFRALCERSGLAGIPLYGLRHQAATTLIDQGVDPRTVSERLGNSVTTVLGTYTRARSSADRSAADMMGSLLDS
jgi:integrase